MGQNGTLSRVYRGGFNYCKRIVKERGFEELARNVRFVVEFVRKVLRLARLVKCFLQVFFGVCVSA